MWKRYSGRYSAKLTTGKSTFLYGKEALYYLVPSTLLRFLSLNMLIAILNESFTRITVVLFIYLYFALQK